MTKLVNMTPWHYFNEEEDFCWLKHLDQRKDPATLCGRRADEVERHTEDRGQVTCRKCLRGIVGMESR